MFLFSTTSFRHTSIVIAILGTILIGLTQPLIVGATSTATSSDTQNTRPQAIPGQSLYQPPVALDERTQARVTNLAANLSTRMDNTAARLSQISSRLEARIALEQANGKDVTLAAAHLSDARNEIRNASSALATIDAAVFAMVTAADSRQAWVSLRNNYLTIATNLRQAHESLKLSADSLLTSSTTTESPTTTNTTE